MNDAELHQSERLDHYVAHKVPDISRAFAAKLIDRGDVKVNGKIQKSSYKIRASDNIEISFEPEQEIQAPSINLRVLYEDKDCVVIEKPTGILSHSKGAYNPEGTVATWLKSRLEDLDGERAGIVHRLDRATSGVMICAKNLQAQSWIQKQFAQRKVKKSYVAVVKGQMIPDEAIIDMPIERNPKKPQTFRVGSNGKSAVTQYESIKQNNKYSLVKLIPTTGRTHQLRVHMEHQGHPILGDTLYGGQPADRLYLHAETLELTLPNRERKVFSVKVPDMFLEKLT